MGISLEDLRVDVELIPSKWAAIQPGWLSKGFRGLPTTFSKKLISQISAAKDSACAPWPPSGELAAVLGRKIAGSTGNDNPHSSENFKSKQKNANAVKNFNNCTKKNSV
jgi:hypothetical protein